MKIDDMVKEIAWYCSVVRANLRGGKGLRVVKADLRGGEGISGVNLTDANLPNAKPDRTVTRQAIIQSPARMKMKTIDDMVKEIAWYCYSVVRADLRGGEGLRNVNLTDANLPNAKPEMKTIFVSRHAGAAEWARQNGFSGVEVVAHFHPTSDPDPVRVIGTLPVHLAALVCAAGGEYWHLSLAIPPELRGRELSADDMSACGAKVERFVVSAANHDDVA